MVHHLISICYRSDYQKAPPPVLLVIPASIQTAAHPLAFDEVECIFGRVFIAAIFET